MHVSLEQAAGFEDHNGAAEATQRLTHRGRGGEALAPDQQLGAKAVLALGRHVGLRGGVRHQSVHRACGDGAFFDQALDAVEEAHEPFCPGVHHARPLEHGEQVRRPLERRFGALDDATDEHPQVALADGLVGLGGRVACHREDGALDGLVERTEQALEARADATGEIPGAGAESVADALLEAQQELGEHHARIAASAAHARLGHRRGHVGEGGVPQAAHGLRDGPQRKTQVGAGVAVWHRKDVETVQLLAARGDPVRRGQQGAAEAGPVHVRDADAHRRVRPTP